MHYGEVQGSETQASFSYNIRDPTVLVLELRKNFIVQFMAKLMDGGKEENAWLLNECVELVAIFAASVKTAERNKGKGKK